MVSQRWVWAAAFAVQALPHGIPHGIPRQQRDEHQGEDVSATDGEELEPLLDEQRAPVRTTPCFLWTRAFVTIRWSDNRLSSVSFEMPVGYFNPDAHW
jgi:hypothetical protein